jgi:hypothetical protein
MQNLKPWLLLSAVWLAVSLACSSPLSLGGTTTDYNGLKGSAVETNPSITTTGKSGIIYVEWNKLTGTLTRTIENKNFRLSDTEADVVVTVTVTSGTVKAYITPKSGAAVEKVVKGGQTDVLNAKAPITAGKFYVFFEAVGGEVNGVKVSISYAVK